MPANTPDQSRTATKSAYRFGEFEVQTESGELFRNSLKVRVQEQSLQVLLALLEKPGTLVTRAELRDRLWPAGTYVDFEHSLNAAVKRLRAALEDDAENPRFIETLPRRGYRLLADVQCETPPATENPPPVPPSQTESRPEGRFRRRLMWWISSSIALLIIGVSIWLHFRGDRGVRSDGNSAIGNTTNPQSGEAYELYLRSIAYKAEPPTNGQAIALLERSTTLDPHSARAWYELARRYHFEYVMAAGGQGFLQHAQDANRRALELAADFPPAKLHQVMLDAEAGQLSTAYNAALAMSRAHPEDGTSHFALSYALRYGGMFEEAAKECEFALKLDPSNPTFRSCSLVFVLLGRQDRASTYVDLDPLSTYARFRRMELALMAHNHSAALDFARSIRLGPRDYPEARLVEAVLSGASQESVMDWSHESEALYDRINLSEGYLVAARYQSWANQTEPALRLLRRAIANNYCAYPVIDSDPLLEKVRRLPEFAQLRQAGISCREKFRAQMHSTH